MNQVGNDKSDEIRKATRRVITELMDRPYTNLARLVEDNLDYWENDLFPILEQENRPSTGRSYMKFSSPAATTSLKSRLLMP